MNDSHSSLLYYQVACRAKEQASVESELDRDLESATFPSLTYFDPLAGYNEANEI